MTSNRSREAGSTTITGVDVLDVRFPTSRQLDGSDAMNSDPDYSAAYVVLRTDRPDGVEGHGLTFTIGRGNELCVEAVRSLSPLVMGMTLEERSPSARATAYARPRPGSGRSTTGTGERRSPQRDLRAFRSGGAAGVELNV